MNNDKEEVLDSQEDIFDDNSEDIGVDESGNSDAQEIFSGGPLSEKELYELCSRKKTKIIYILGSVGSGKTTFGTMMYARFLRVIDESLMFAGSRTLVGFEEKMSALRVQSGESDVDMPRTRISDDARCFYHMALRDKEEEKNIILSDISGESFEKCKSSVENLKHDLKLIDIASDVIIMLDGEKLIDKTKRNTEVIRAKSFLTTLKSSKMYRDDLRIRIIISKNDKIYNQLKKDDTISKFASSLEEKFSNFTNVFDITFFCVEAINELNLQDPKNSTHLLDLLKDLLSTNQNKMKHITQKRSRNFISEYNKFSERYKYE